MFWLLRVVLCLCVYGCGGEVASIFSGGCLPGGSGIFVAPPFSGTAIFRGGRVTRSHWLPTLNSQPSVRCATVDGELLLLNRVVVGRGVVVSVAVVVVPVVVVPVVGPDRPYVVPRLPPLWLPPLWWSGNLWSDSNQ